MKKKMVFEERGVQADLLAGMLGKHKDDDAKWAQGKTFGFVYHPGKEYAEIPEAYRSAFQYENTLNPSTFPSLRKFEKEVLEMACELMHGNARVAGNVTTGGTESIFLALKVARETAFERFGNHVQAEVILPATIHPAFIKGCNYLSLKPVMVPVTSGGKADPDAIRKAIGKHTIMLGASAPCFPYGVVDPVGELGKIALQNNLLLHVDACMGGFMLPFLEDLGYDIPQFDFRIAGVTSISLDAHKYGYAPKGTSIILYRNRKLRRKQFFIHTEWPGGIFASATFMGTKSGGPVAGCWAIMKHLGREGYREIVAEVMKTSVRIREGISGLKGLEIIGDPRMSVMAFTSREGNIFNIGDALQRKGWHLDRLQFPDALHLTVNRLNVGREEEFLKDLREVLDQEQELTKEYKTTRNSIHVVDTLSRIFPSSVVDRFWRLAGRKMDPARGKSRIPQAALYGISSSSTDRKNIRNLVINLLDGMY